ncbi:redox-active disulfide protein 2 [Sphingobacterium gobiense]|nr:redox-active disulfide protein 2 [Sphingobacterium gobiense]
MPLTELSTEQLVKNKRITSIITGSLAGILIILFVQSIHAWATEGYPSAIAIPIALSPTVFIYLKKIKEIKRELEMRGKF